MYFYHLPAIDFKQKRKGVYGKIVTGKKIQLCYIKLDYETITNHSHPHEQMGYILSGEVKITICEEQMICKQGDVYYVPSNTQHEFRVLSRSGVEYIEIFSPPKKENKNLASTERV